MTLGADLLTLREQPGDPEGFSVDTIGGIAYRRGMSKPRKTRRTVPAKSVAPVRSLRYTAATVRADMIDASESRVLAELVDDAFGPTEYLSDRDWYLAREPYCRTVALEICALIACGKSPAAFVDLAHYV